MIKKIICIISHCLAGLLTSSASLIDPSLAWIGFAGFELYENLQYLKKDDWAIGETREYMAGFFAGILLLLVTFHV